jgi:NADH dehydrogenase
MSNAATRVVILGGGFAGVYTAAYLGRSIPRGQRPLWNVDLVSQENYLVFQPMLPEVISGAIETLHVISPIRRLAPYAHLHTREIEQIDLENRTVRLAPGFVPRPMTLGFDQLVIALGTRLDYSKVPGMHEHAIAFKYLGDALRLRNHLVHVLEEAELEQNPQERARLLTFVVGGGGFSGVECIAEMNDFLHSAIRAYPRLKASELRLILLQSAERILPEMTEGLADFAHRILQRRGVEIRLHTRLKAVTAAGAVIQRKGDAQSELIPTRTTVATVPAAPHPLVAQLGLPLEGGRIRVNEHLAVPDHPGVWALGDCAAVPQLDGRFSPPTAQHALRQAKVCAANVRAAIAGAPLETFRFTGLGKLGSLGRRSAVAEVMGLKISGFLAWLLWRAIYLAKFPGWDRRIRIAADWILDLFLPRDITQVRIFHGQSVAREHFEPGEMVFEQGDFGDKIYFIVDGQAEIIRDGTAIATAGPGEVVGEVALVSDCPRTATVRAKTPLNAVTVSRDAFQQLLARLPGMEATMHEIMRRRGIELDTEQTIRPHALADLATQPERP